MDELRCGLAASGGQLRERHQGDGPDGPMGGLWEGPHSDGPVGALWVENDGGRWMAVTGGWP